MVQQKFSMKRHLGFFGIVLLGLIAVIALPNLPNAIQRSKVSRTMADMRVIGTVLNSYQADYHSYPVQLTQAVFSNEILPEEYYRESLQDAWGNGFRYVSEDGTRYKLTSYGKDRREGKSSSMFDVDILYANGEFLAPDAATHDETLRSTVQERVTLREESVVSSPTSVPQLPTTTAPVPAATPIALRSEPLTVSDVSKLKVYNARPLEYIENHFEDQGDVVVDHATGLMWQKSGSQEPLTYAEAQEYVENLNRQRFAGHDDWRLPTIPELMSLLEPEERSNSLYIALIFDNQQHLCCWSADKRSSRTVWVVDFFYGKVAWLKLGSNYYARAVRV